MQKEILTWKQKTWEERVQAFLETDDAPERFDFPFPMGVFGTLRKNQGNNPLMHLGKVEKHRQAFLPHFSAQSLTIVHEHNSTAPFEVFQYKPAEWAKMIGRVDGLEGFHPTQNHGDANNGYYYRTLVWLHLLPKDYEDEWFPKGRADLWGHRNMKIDPKIWNDYEKMPCWVYSNMRATKQAAKEENTPIIWPTELYKDA